jgi:hypothetical protein
MTTDKISGNAANSAKKKPRGKPFVSGDPRSNTTGQRNGAAVAFARSLRELIVDYGNQDKKVYDKQGKLLGEKSNVEWMVQSVWQAALKGEQWAVNFIAERTEGKVNQTVDVILKMIDYSKLTDEQIERIANGENPIAVVLGG